VPDSPGSTPDEIRRRLAERERQELAAVHRRLSTDTKPCRCGGCVEADVQAWEERELRRGIWHGF
jgi:hypothetical protein